MIASRARHTCVIYERGKRGGPRWPVTSMGFAPSIAPEAPPAPGLDPAWACAPLLPPTLCANKLVSSRTSYGECKSATLSEETKLFSVVHPLEFPPTSIKREKKTPQSALCATIRFMQTLVYGGESLIIRNLGSVHFKLASLLIRASWWSF